MTDTKEFRISYSVVSTFDVVVERPADIKVSELISSVTRDEIESGQHLGCEWDAVKDAWLGDEIYLITDSKGEQLY